MTGEAQLEAFYLGVPRATSVDSSPDQGNQGAGRFSVVRKYAPGRGTSEAADQVAAINSAQGVGYLQVTGVTAGKLGLA